MVSTDETACRVAPTTPAETTGALADALVRLADDPGLRARMGAAARRRAGECYLWPRKAEAMIALYAEARALDGAGRSASVAAQ